MGQIQWACPYVEAGERPSTNQSVKAHRRWVTWAGAQGNARDVQNEAKQFRRGTVQINSKRLILSLTLIVVGIFLSAALSACADKLGEAKHLDSQGDIKAAIVAYESVLKQDPDNVQALSGLGADLFASQQFDQALPIEEKTVRLDAGDVQTRVELGFNYLNHQNRPSDAVRVLNEAAKTQGTAKNLNFLAQAQLAAGDDAAAKATLRQAIAKDPKYPHSYQMLDKILLDEGRTSEAAAVRRQASDNGLEL